MLQGWRGHSGGLVAGAGPGPLSGHGVRGLVSLYGIESPGLTSSLAIAEEVTRLLDC